MIREDSIDSFCDSLIERFEYTAKEREANFTRVIEGLEANNRRHDEELACKKQQEEARIAKEQAEAKTKAEAFACRRCPAKYPSNTQLHKHIDEHHTKKPKDTKSEISTPTSEAKPAIPEAPKPNHQTPATSITQNHKTPSPSPPKEPLNAPAPITPPATPITSPKIT